MYEVDFAVYKITHASSGRIYIGSSCCSRRRWNAHRSNLRHGRHPSPLLQAAWNKHGEDAFEFDVIELCTRQTLLSREQYHIDTLKPYYNVAPVVSSRVGVPQSISTRIKISAAHKGKRRIRSEEHQRNLLAAAARSKTPEWRRKISLAHTGMKMNLSAEQRARISANTIRVHTGRKRSLETREKIRQKAIGRKRSPEAVARWTEKMRLWREARSKHVLQ
jgi:group I intron endonuclease